MKDENIQDYLLSIKNKSENIIPKYNDLLFSIQQLLDYLREKTDRNKKEDEILQVFIGIQNTNPLIIQE
jgi:hypothetical protein